MDPADGTNAALPVMEDEFAVEAEKPPPLLRLGVVAVPAAPPVIPPPADDRLLSFGIPVG